MLVYTACTAKPCENAGWCIQRPFGFSCKCRLGYAGKRCEYGEPFIISLLQYSADETIQHTPSHPDPILQHILLIPSQAANYTSHLKLTLTPPLSD